MTLLQTTDFSSGWTDQILNTFENGIVDGIVLQVTAKTLLIAIFLGVIFYLITLGMNYLRTSIGKFVNPDVGFFIDFDELFRAIGILCLIVLYIPLMSVINGTVNLAYHMTKPSGHEYDVLSENGKQFEENGRTYYMETDLSVLYEIKSSYEKNHKTYTKEAYDFAVRQIKKAEQAKGTKMVADQSNNSTSSSVKSLATTVTPSESGKQEKEESWLAKIVNGIGWLLYKIVNIIVGILVQLIVGIVKYVTMAIAKVWLKILFIFGPLALAFSILPMFRKQAEHWFGYYLNTAFVFLTFNVLDHIFYGFLSVDSMASSSTTYEALNTESNLLIINLVMIIAYLSSFRITSYYVGKGEAGRAVGKAVGHAADLAKLAIGAKYLSSGSGSGGGSNLLQKTVNSMNKGSGSKIKDEN